MGSPTTTVRAMSEQYLKYTAEIQHYKITMRQQPVPRFSVGSAERAPAAIMAQKIRCWLPALRMKLKFQCDLLF